MLIMIELNVNGIPASLKEKKQWVGFKIVEGGKKVPIDPNFNHDLQWASINNPDTWGSFASAAKLVELGECIAVGYALTKEDGLIFVDLDCHTDGCSSEEERKKVEQFYHSLCKGTEVIETYRETSLSGNGVHLLAKGELLEGYKVGSSKVAPIELYTHGRFVIMTGNKLNDFDIDDSERTIGAIHNLQKQFFEVGQEPSTSSLSTSTTLYPPLDTSIYTDEEVLGVAMKDQKFNLLWEGKWEDVKNKDGSPVYTSQHYADYALVKKLIYYTANTPTQAERLYRQSPCYQAYGKNGKWAKFEADIAKDFKKASQNCGAIYTPINEGVVVPADFKPDFPAIYKMLDGNDNPFKSPALTSILKGYVLKYQYQNPQYIPYLFKEDRNVNGATNIVKKVVGDNLKYSRSLRGYFLWNGKKFEGLEEDLLIDPITNILGMVEHSVFQWIMQNVAQDGEDGKDGKGNEDASSLQEGLEKKAIALFGESKKYVDVRLAKNVLLKLKGMDVAQDVKTYYETPYINMQNGAFDLEQRELRPHNPAYGLYKITGCDYDPTATCPTFEDMVARIIPEEQDRKELQKAFGLCLAKKQLPAKKVLMLLVGPKDTGKTTLLNTIVEVLGEYGSQVDNSLLMQSKKNKTVGPEMFDFREALMISTSETSANEKLDTAKIKALTGDTVQSIRNNFATTMDKFKMIGLIFIDSNFRPYIPPMEVATWDRLRLFPFLYPVTKKDPKLKEKLESEKPGIFNWILRGLDMVLEDGEIRETPNMAAYKNDYQGEMDITGQFFQECIEESTTDTDRVQTSILYSCYKGWCKDNGYMDIIRNKFYEEVNKRFEKKKSGVEFFTKMRFTPLGLLYSQMGEMTQQDFSKKKRKLLQTDDTELTYAVLRRNYYTKAKPWFVEHITVSNLHAFDLNTAYSNYIEWCCDRGVVPIKREDFRSKTNYIFECYQKYNGIQLPKGSPETFFDLAMEKWN